MKLFEKIRPVAAIVIISLFLLAGLVEYADARSRGGGRSFGQQRTITQPRPPAATQTQAARPGTTGAFTRGLAGGLMGGIIGSMLFGTMAHGAGAGGLGGSGIGLIEILLLAGLGYYLYRRFMRPGNGRSDRGNTTSSLFSRDTSTPGLNTGGPDAEMLDAPPDNRLVAGVRQIWEVDISFDPERFKETAQDLFFKIQAGWTQRRSEVLAPYVGEQLLAEYSAHFDELRRKGHVNRLENIAMRKVNLEDAGVEDGEIYIVVRFTANLLDYTVDEATGQVIDGDPDNPVKFEENWSFARSLHSDQWKLEGIET